MGAAATSQGTAAGGGGEAVVGEAGARATPAPLGRRSRLSLPRRLGLPARILRRQAAASPFRLSPLRRRRGEQAPRGRGAVAGELPHAQAPAPGGAAGGRGGGRGFEPAAASQSSGRTCRRSRSSVTRLCVWRGGIRAARRVPASCAAAAASLI